MTEYKRNTPPQWIQSLLRRFASEQTLEEVEGDLLEFYPQWINHRGEWRANLKYFFTVVTLLRPFKRHQLFEQNHMMMMYNYFMMSWRTIVRNKVSSFINLSSLTLGLTTSLLILLVILQEYEYDQGHVKKDKLFLMMKNQKTNEGIHTGRSTAGPMAETLKKEYPQVAHAARVAFFHGVSINSNEKRFKESGVYVDPDLFHMMTFSALAGEPAKALSSGMAVLTRAQAIKLFGEADPMGQVITLDHNNSTSVGAIIENIPHTNSIRFDMALPFQTFEKNNDWLTKWDDNRIQTWVELNSASDLNAFNLKVASLIEEKTSDPNETVFAYPLQDLHLRNSFSNGYPSGGRITIIRIVIALGIFLILIACANFMNIATAQATHRAKEVGIRKVLGSGDRSLMLRFLNEAFVLTFAALMMSVSLTLLILPSFNELMHTSISFEFNNGLIWAMCISIAIITSLIAGSYPAFVLSRFSPARVLKGIIDRPGGSSVRRILVTFQFVISISVVIGTMILFAQFDHIKSRPLGYSQDNLVNIPLDSLASTRFTFLKDQISAIAGVRAVTGTGGNILYSGGAVTGMDWPGKKPGEDLSIVIADVAYDWTKTMEIEMRDGRDFSEQMKSDANACLLNLSAVQKMGLENPVGSIVGGHTVIGVFNNYVYNNPSGDISPMIVYLAPQKMNHLYIRIANNDVWQQTVKQIEEIIKSASPDWMNEFRFTKLEYQSRFEELSDVAMMVTVFGGMTILISCFGLFGLSGYMAERRAKEISIRKVFGADSLRVLWNLTSDLLKPVAMALLIVIPLSVWISDLVLQQLVYRVPLTAGIFVEAILLVLTISLLVIIYHAWRATVEHPAVRLRSE